MRFHIVADVLFAFDDYSLPTLGSSFHIVHNEAGTCYTGIAPDVLLNSFLAPVPRFYSNEL